MINQEAKTISAKKYPEFDDRLEYAEMRRRTVEEKLKYMSFARDNDNCKYVDIFSYGVM